jgi:hypothetical protein
MDIGLRYNDSRYNASVTQSLSVYFSYTNNDSTYIGTPGAQANALLGVFPGNTVFGSAEDMFVISTDWRRNNYAAGLTYKQIGERWLDAGNTQRLDGYGVADLCVSVDLTEQPDDFLMRAT